MRKFVEQEYGKEYVVYDYDDGWKYWYFDNKRHREYGPAVYLEGNVWWFKCGYVHRDDGCAMYIDKDKAYYINNKYKSFYDLLFYEERERDKK
jgi:hypothetical protein